MKIEILPTEQNANLLGEILRDVFFDQTKGFGCYETFNLNQNVKMLPTNKDEDGEVWTNASIQMDGITVFMHYSWDGDGRLMFYWDENQKHYCLMNGDCKKDHRWELFVDKVRQEYV